MPSFICERTAEYSLLPVLQRSLQQQFKNAIPLFFWGNREGSKWAAELHKGRRFRVLALFARRPKRSDADHMVRGRINSEICAFANAALSAGIPTVMGFLAVRDIFELYNEGRHYWLGLRPGSLGEFEFDIDLISGDFKLCPGSDAGISLLDTSEITGLISRHSQIFQWDEAIGVIRRLRADGYLGVRHFVSSWWSYGGYKPVYILIED